MTSSFDDDELSMSLNSNPLSRQSHRPSQNSTRPPRPPPVGEQVTSKIPADRSTAQRVGLYEVVKTLGEGSFGKVKLATHRVTKQQVALKIISRKKLISRDMAGRVVSTIHSLMAKSEESTDVDGFVISWRRQGLTRGLRTGERDTILTTLAAPSYHQVVSEATLLPR